MSVFDRAADLWEPRNQRFRDDPVGWITEELGEFIWSKQREIAEACQTYDQVAVKACHGPGKSYLAARLVAHVVAMYGVGANVITTAPTAPQVKGILWREINGIANKYDGLPGKVNQTDWMIDNVEVAIGRKPSDYNEQAFQGRHGDRMGVIIDEASGVPKTIFDAGLSLVTGENGFVLAIGNPDNSDSYFAEICKPGSGWHVITISAFDTPNFTGEWVPEYLAKKLTQPSWVEKRRHDWGEDSPLYISKVLAEFPVDSEETVVPFSAVSKCRIPQDDSDVGEVWFGLDVGAGGDSSVLTAKRGRKALWQDEWHTPDTMSAVGRSLQAIKDHGARRIMVDTIGVGKGVFDRLAELRTAGEHDCQVVAVNVGTSSSNSKEWAKLRDELWWKARDRSMNQRWDLSELSDDAVNELTTARYDIDSSGRAKVEPKKETKKRLGKSPDKADSLLLAFYEAPGTGPMRTYGRTIAAARI